MTSPLHVAEAGSDRGPGVIWLHGALVAGWMWTEQVAALPDYHHLVPDLPGVGHSAGCPAGGLDDIADRLIDACRERAREPVHLVGLSLGAVVGLRMLSRAPDLFARAVLSGPLAEPVHGPLAALQRVILRLYRRPRGAHLVARVLGLPDDVRAAFLATAAATPPETYRRLLPEVYRTPLPAAGLDRVDHPVLLVTGSRDTAVTRRSVRLLLERLPNAAGCWADGLGHQWNAEDGPRFSAMVEAWLTRQPLPAGLTAIADER